MAVPSRRLLSPGPSDIIHLCGVLSSKEDFLGMRGEYRNDPKLPTDYSYLPALEYLDHYASLPAHRPVGYPHLINIEKYKEENQRANLRVADAVVTVLHNWEPEALAAFLDMEREDFRFQVDDSKVYPHNFYIQRKHNRCGYVDYESHEYWIERSGEWTPKSVIIKIRGRSKENQVVHRESFRDPCKPISSSDHNRDIDDNAAEKPKDSHVKRVYPGRAPVASNGATIRMGFIDKIREKAMIDDGAKLADDVLALPVWAAGPLIRFKTIGVRLRKKRMDTEALDE